MAFGVTSLGFYGKTLDEIQAELEADFKAEFGASIDLDPRGPFGQIIGIFAERLVEVQELGAAIYAAATVDGATGAALDDLCGLTGTVREAATKSTVTAALTGTNGTNVPAGSAASVAVTAARFVTTALGVLATVGARAALTPYTLGQRRSNNSNVYQVIASGTSSAGGGPTTTASDITDGTVHWGYVGPGLAAVDVAAEAVATGPTVAAAGTLTTIETPVAGWSGINNILDAALGQDEEGDTALRVRREAELRASGKSALEAIRETLLAVADVTAVTVFENVTDTTDIDTIPPHAVEALVQGGTDAAVAAGLFASVAAGIATYGQGGGAITQTVTDSQGIDHTIKFSRPTEINIYVTVNLIVDTDTYPADGDAQVKAAIVAFGNSGKTGKDAVAASLGAQAFTIPGVLDTTSVFIDTAPGPILSTTLDIGIRQVAVYDTSRIVVATTPGDP